MRPRVYVRLMGGLGNQLFQVAHAYRLASEGIDVRLDTSWFSKRPTTDTVRQQEVDASVTGLPTASLPASLWSPRLRLVNIEGFPVTSRLRAFVGRAARLESGYWQSWAWVDEVRAHMAACLERLLDSRLQVPQPRQDFVAIHVRLGDYLEPATRDFHGLTDQVQQMDLAARMASEIGVSRIRVFTDSPGLLAPAIFAHPGFELDASATSVAAMAGMASAAALVMSNSSLSWWAATLAAWWDSRPMVVAAPTPWFSAPSTHDAELIRPRWTPYLRTGTTWEGPGEHGN